MKLKNMIDGSPVAYPRRKVTAWVGAFASDFLGDFDSPAKAAQYARERGYRIVHVIYRNGESDCFDLTERQESK